MSAVVNIKTPIWSNRSFGIADFRLEGDGNILVRCSYRTKDGEKLYPHLYIMEKQLARSYPRIKTGEHWGRQIPINDFLVAFGKGGQ